MSSYRETLYDQARASAEAGAEWREAEAGSLLAEVEATETKIGVIRRARDAGVTWPGLAESFHYGDPGPGGEVDWVRAGKALRAWYASHANDQAQETRDAASASAAQDIEQAKRDFEIAGDYARAVAREAMPEDEAADVR